MMMMMKTWTSAGLGKVLEYESSRRRKSTFHELKQKKTWFDEECSELLGERKQAKLKLLQNSCQRNGHNRSNIRCDTSRIFKEKRREYLKYKLMSLKEPVRAKK
jgi:hypothetical protein